MIVNGSHSNNLGESSNLVLVLFCFGGKPRVCLLYTSDAADDLDDALREVDPALPLPTETVEQVVDRIMQGSLTADAPVVPADEVAEADLIRPVRRTLIHARGCTAVKLIRKAQEHGYEVVLVQSDPDMDSVPTDMVEARPGDSVVSLGGNTSDESYLNAASVLALSLIHISRAHET